MPPGRGCRAEVKSGDAVDPPVPHGHHAASSRRSTWATAGQGGHAIQLEKVGLAVEARRWPPKPLYQIPEDEPVNDMAPTPHQRKKRTLKVATKSKDGGLSTLPSNVPNDRSSQLLASQDEQPAMPEDVLQPSLTSCPSGSHFGLQLENPPVPTYVGSQTTDTYEREHINNSTLSRTKKATQLNPTTRPQSSQSCAAIQTPQGLPMTVPLCPPAHKVPSSNQLSLSPSVGVVPSSPLSLPSSPEAPHSSNTKNNNLDNRECHQIDLDEWAGDEIDQSGCNLLHLPPIQTQVQVLRKPTDMMIVSLITQEKKDNSVKSLCQFAEFQQYVPYKALLLVAAIIHEVLCIYKTHGFIPKESKLNSKALDGAFKMMVPKLEAVVSHAYHGPKLNAMLEEWANLSMTGYTPVGRPAATHESSHFDIILD
ncbi:hypothetical protein PISMIDRAFT_10521 [Pisolithus microcarpus 441]|uniref:Uncharacterized protein n=1 Tax=Pisolithus microcarpus 441 TaxID=765257 RepID=A0A0C9ZW67_9AGAM|nr:hypothetical protein BKA83DRAFT_10521 [Pisolithus microcarpus]KIK23908.1 hypothetical protein PISMIDRAFT_10521 [Pisolithus microcarpus 441]